MTCVFVFCGIILYVRINNLNLTGGVKMNILYKMTGEPILNWELKDIEIIKIYNPITHKFSTFPVELFVKEVQDEYKTN